MRRPAGHRVGHRQAGDVDLDHLRRSYLRHALDALPAGTPLGANDYAFLAEETRSDRAFARMGAGADPAARPSREQSGGGCTAGVV